MHQSVFLKIILLLLAASSSIAAAQTGILEPGFSNGVPYLSGGIGDEELEEIDRARPSYNTRLVFSEASGAYVSNVALNLATVLGEPIVSLSSAGPMVLLQLPPGSYLITTSYDGKTLQKRLDVRDNTARTVSIFW